MNSLFIRDLLARIAVIEGRAVQRRVGVVTTASPLAVAVGGSAVPYTNCKRLASYTPVLNDTVAVDIFGNDLLVLGKIS